MPVAPKLEETLEPLLCYAKESLRHKNWNGAHEVLRTCRDLAEMYREPVTAEYDPAQVLRASIAGSDLEVTVREALLPNCTGDLVQLGVIARLLLQSAHLDLEATLEVAMIDLEGVPTIRMAIEGPGRFIDPLKIPLYVHLNGEDVEAVWIRATRGGRIDRQPERLDLRLKGVRVTPTIALRAGTLVEPIQQAEESTRLLSAEAGGDVGQLSSAAKRAIDTALAMIDADDSAASPGDLPALLNELAKDNFSLTDTVRFEMTSTSPLPPITFRRNRIVRLFRSMAKMSEHSFLHGGTLACTLEYDASARAAVLWLNGQGKVEPSSTSFYMPTIMRCIGDLGGDVELDASPAGFILALTLPDTVGRALDAWIPGWSTFSPRSIQMLRLLKSGGPVPPEELILGGVLEDELERRLLPRLSVAPATNLAHDLKPKSPGPPGSSADRAEKALGQIRKGKPKKEICSPAYAGELLWLFSVDERHRNAVGCGRVSEEVLKAFCLELLSDKLNYPVTLRLMAECLDVP